MSRWQNPTLFEDSDLKNTIGGMSGIALLVMSSAMLAPQRAFAASSAGCAGGGFSVLGLSGDHRAIVAAGKVDRAFLVKGQYITFPPDSDTFALPHSHPPRPPHTPHHT